MKMLDFKAGPRLFSLNPKVVPQMQHVDFLIPYKMFGRKCVSLRMGCGLGRFSERTRTGCYAVLLGVGNTEVSTSELEGFSVTTKDASGSNELKQISINVSGAKTQEIFDKVFSRMVEDAQPIPGFRRVKGGKTPNIPREILLEVLGYSKVYKQVIKKIINSTISEYLKKSTDRNRAFNEKFTELPNLKPSMNGLTVSKDLQIEQSFEDLEAICEPGDPFTFNAIVQRHHPQ